MQRLTGLDAAFLALETPSAHMQVLGVAIVDPRPRPRAPFHDRVRALLEARLHLVPPLRRRLVEVPFGLHVPVWIEDPAFDLDYHLRRAALPAPGGPQRARGLRRRRRRTPARPRGTRSGRRMSSKGSSTAIRRSSPRCTTR